MKNLKKISFGAFAFLFGLTVVLTQSAFKGDVVKNFNRLPVTLYYHGPNFTSTEVVKPENWNDLAPEDACSPAQEQACSITIDNAFTQSVGSRRELNNSAALTASPAGSTYYITGSADQACPL